MDDGVLWASEIASYFYLYNWSRQSVANRLLPRWTERYCTFIENSVDYSQDTGVSVSELLIQFWSTDILTYLLLDELPKRFFAATPNNEVRTEEPSEHFSALTPTSSKNLVTDLNSWPWNQCKNTFKTSDPFEDEKHETPVSSTLLAKVNNVSFESRSTSSFGGRCGQEQGCRKYLEIGKKEKDFEWEGNCGGRERSPDTLPTLLVRSPWIRFGRTWNSAESVMIDSNCCRKRKQAFM